MGKHENLFNIQPGLLVRQDATGQVAISFMVPSPIDDLKLSAEEARSMLLDIQGGKTWHDAGGTCEFVRAADPQMLQVMRRGESLHYQIMSVVRAIYTVEFVQKAIATALEIAKK